MVIGWKVSEKAAAVAEAAIAMVVNGLAWRRRPAMAAPIM